MHGLSLSWLCADTRHWFTLRRRDAGDNVSGRLQLEFAWDVTARSLLSLKLAALENVLCQRTEILCALNPVPASRAYKWLQKAPDTPQSHKAGWHPSAKAWGSELFNWAASCQKAKLPTQYKERPV